ncbi:MAG: hypothetical protein WA766_14020, partial [Candidatus Acidiferrales bacterium]
NYGASSVWDEIPKSYGGAPWPDQPYPGIQKPLPPPDTRIANVLWDLDVERFKKLFIDLMTRPQRTP